MKTQIIKAVNYLTLFSILFLTASSIYYYKVQKIGFILFFLFYFLEIVLEKKWKNIKLSKVHFYFAALAFFFFLTLLYMPFESTSKYARILLEKRFSLLGFAIVGFFGVNSKFKLNYFLNTIIISSIIAIIYLLFFRIGIVEYIQNPQRNDVFKIVRIEYVNSHMVFNFYLNLAMVGIWYILTRSWSRTIWWKRYLYIAALTTIFGMLSMSEGRSGFFVSILLMLGFIFFEIWKRRKLMGIIIGLVIPVLFIGVVSQHKRMSEKTIEAEPRLFLWKSAISVISENPVFGNGVSDAQVKFDAARARYQTADYKQLWIKSPHLDSHNQYLQTTMEFGFVGLIFILFLLSFPYFIAEKNRKLFAFFLLFLCAYQCVFDMFLTGPFSAIFGILMILVLCVKNNIAKPLPRNTNRD